MIAKSIPQQGVIQYRDGKMVKFLAMTVRKARQVLSKRFDIRTLAARALKKLKIASIILGKTVMFGPPDEKTKPVRPKRRDSHRRNFHRQARHQPAFC